MMDNLLPFTLILAAYILGSVPFGMLVARLKGIDIQKTGSGNIGATNVLRAVGKGPALLTLIGDSMKGAIAVIICRQFMEGEFLEGTVGISAVLGHLYPIFLSFKGGKGVATGFGVSAAYNPVPSLAALAVWIIVAFSFRYSSLSAITAFLSLPVFFVLFGSSNVKIFFAIILAFLIILRHKSNIERLLNGTEAKIGDKKD
jgi:glycerol-3-phosphate acyltransferase PlsY